MQCLFGEEGECFGSTCRGRRVHTCVAKFHCHHQIAGILMDPIHFQGWGRNAGNGPSLAKMFFQPGLQMRGHEGPIELNGHDPWI